MEAFGKVITILFSVMVLFITPVLYVAQKQDSIAQNYVQAETVQFVDAIKNNGYLKKEMYELYLKKIRITGNVYAIELTQSHPVITPKESVADPAVIEGIWKHYYNTYTEDVLNELEEKGIYYLNQGDLISIKVVNINKTFAAKMMHMIIQREIPTTQIYVTYGGVIRDEAY